MKEEDWIQDLMNQLDELPKAPMREGFAQQLEQTIGEELVKRTRVRPMHVWLAAASIVLLILLNWSMVGSPENTSETSSYEELLENYGLSIDNNPYSTGYDE